MIQVLMAVEVKFLFNWRRIVLQPINLRCYSAIRSLLGETSSGDSKIACYGNEISSNNKDQLIGEYPTSIGEDLDFHCHQTQNHHILTVDPGGPVVIILATGAEVRGFKPGRGRWIFSERKNPKYDILRKGSKAEGHVS